MAANLSNITNINNTTNSTNISKAVLNKIPLLKPFGFRMNRFSKQLVAIVSLTLIGCLYLQHLSDCQPRPTLAASTNNPKQCKPRSNIVFIKAHKCASSAIQNIFMRYGFFNKKIFVLPETGNYLGHPTLFKRYLVPDPKSFNGQYNILTHHSRLNYDEMHKLMPTDTIFITIIRKPVNLFESMFHYYKLDNLWNIQFDDFNVPGSFIPRRIKDVRLIGKIGINQMMFDMGFPAKDFDDENKVRNYIRKLDQIFSLVLVSERMEESLVLLKRLLCWSFDDVVVFKVNARSDKSKHAINQTGVERIEQLNKADQILYDHFLQKFNRLVRKYGQKRMERDLKLLRQKTKQYFDKCVNKTVTNAKTNIVRFISSQEDDLQCQFLTHSELSLTKFIRKEQIKRYPNSVFHNNTNAFINSKTTASVIRSAR